MANRIFDAMADRRFGGKIYKYYDEAKTKATANQIAANLRKKGNLVRVVDTKKIGFRYKIYRR